MILASQPWPDTEHMIKPNLQFSDNLDCVNCEFAKWQSIDFLCVVCCFHSFSVSLCSLVIKFVPMLWLPLLPLERFERVVKHLHLLDLNKITFV